MKAEELLHRAYELGASDVHLTVNSPVLYRIHGQLKPQFEGELKPADTMELAKQLMSLEQFNQFLEDGDIDFSYGITNIGRFRINVYKQRGCVGLAIRLIPTHIPSLEELRLPSVMKDFVQKPQGLVLVTGPTGSGKTTTLASLIEYLNMNKQAHIITLEDPIEFTYEHQKSIINQREIGLDTASFSQGLRAALRQDPDVILVGEMRDLETISTAIRAAETGHLVLATLHTADAPQTIDRIIDVFPAETQAQIRLQLSTVLLGILSQRLLPRRDGKGRVAAFEVLVNTPATSNLIRSEKVFQIRSVMQTSRNQGMQTMDASLRELVQQGQITVEDAQKALFGFAEL